MPDAIIINLAANNYRIATAAKACSPIGVGGCLNRYAQNHLAAVNCAAAALRLSDSVALV